MEDMLLAYVQEHLVVDHVAETTQAAVKLLLEACSNAPYTDTRSLGSSYDPFVTLFCDLRLHHLPQFDEAWTTTKDTVAHIRKAVPPQNGADLTTQSVWHQEDPPFKPSTPLDIEPILTRQAIRQTPKPAPSRHAQEMSQLQKVTRPTMLQMPVHPDDSVLSEDDIIFLRPQIDNAARDLVVSYLRSCKPAQGQSSAPSPAHSISLEAKISPYQRLLATRPMSPSLFSRAASSGRGARLPSTDDQTTSLRRIEQLQNWTVPVELPKEDLDAAHMKIVDGWAVLPEPLSPPLSPTPSLTDGSSSNIDELHSPPPLRRGFTMPSPDAKRDFLSCEMDIVEIPRSHRIGQGQRTPPAQPSMAHMLRPLLSPFHDGPTADVATGQNSGPSAAAQRLPPSGTGTNELILSELPESLRMEHGDPFNVIAQERLDDNVFMDVPDLPEGNELVATSRATAADMSLSKLLFKRDGHNELDSTQLKVLKKAPLKALSMELSWRPVKLGDDLPSANDVNGQLLNDEPVAVQALLSFVNPAIPTISCASARAFEDSTSTSAPLLTDDRDLSTLLTREERLRLKRQHNAVDVATTFDADLEEPPRKRTKQPRVSPSSDLLFSPRLEDALTSLPTSTSASDDAVFELYQSNHASQAQDFVDQSQFSAFSFDTDFAGVSKQRPKQFATNASSQMDVADGYTELVSERAVVHNGARAMFESQDGMTTSPSAVDHHAHIPYQSHEQLERVDLDAPTFALPGVSPDGPNNVHPLARFLAFKGQPLLLTVLNPALHSSPPGSPDPPAHIEAAEPPAYLPDEILRLKPLLLPAFSSGFASTPAAHRYLVSLDFAQKRSVVSALNDYWNVELIERQQLTSQECVHILLDCDSCVVFYPLARLVTADKSLVADIETMSRSFSSIAVVFECYQDRAKTRTLDRDSALAASCAFTPPVIKSAKRFRRALDISQDGLDTIPSTVNIQLAFAHDPEEAAAFVRLLGEVAYERSLRSNPALAQELWDDRSWLRADEEYEDETLVASLPSMNAFTAIVMLSRASAWDDVLDMPPEERHARFGALVGTHRIDVINADLAERIHKLTEELQELSSPLF